jgi:hypothetical protein
MVGVWELDQAAVPTRTVCELDGVLLRIRRLLRRPDRVLKLEEARASEQFLSPSF